MSRSRTERLVNLVICLLSTRRFLTAAQIAATVPGYEHDPEDPKDHEAFQRKFERDKAELRELGVPLEIGTPSAFDNEPGYRIARREYALPDILLEPDEAAAVGIAARLWQHAGLAAAASSGLAKLRAAGVEVDPQATLGVEPVVTVDPAFEPLTSAARDRRAVTFDYRAPESDAADHPPAAAVGRGVLAGPLVCGRPRPRPPAPPGASGCPGSSATSGSPAVPGAFTPPADVDLISHVARWSGRSRTPAGPRCGPARPGRRAAPLGDRARWPGPDGDRILTMPYADVERLAATLVGYGADVRARAGRRSCARRSIQQLKEVVARHDRMHAPAAT